MMNLEKPTIEFVKKNYIFIYTNIVKTSKLFICLYFYKKTKRLKKLWKNNFFIILENNLLKNICVVT